MNHPVKREHARPFNFTVQLNWLEKNKGILTAHDAKGPIYVATPLQFGGEGQDWSPEHLFLSAVCSCFMTTFLVFAGKFGFSATHIDCEASAVIDLVNGKYEFIRVDLFPVITVSDATAITKAEKALEKTQKYCLVSNSIKCTPQYHSKVLLQNVSRQETKAQTI